MTDESREVRAPLAEAVRERRQYLGLSKRGAAKRAGMSEDTWRRIEDGDASVSDRMLDGTAAALEIEPAELYRLAGRNYQPVARKTDPRIATLANEIAQMGEALQSMAEVLRRMQAP